MADPIFYLKQDDLAPVLEATLKDKDGAVNLIGLTVTFRMCDSTGARKVDDQAASFVTDGSDGVVQYAWQSGDTDTAGTFRGEFVVAFAGPKPMSFPNAGAIQIVIAQKC